MPIRSSLPSISVTILTKNSAKTLAETLDALTRFPEVLVIDTGSTDGSLEIAKKYPNVHLLFEPFQGFGKLHNLASQKASQDWILSIDSEITPVERVRTSKRAFERMVEYMHERRADGADAWVVQHVQAQDVADRLVARGREVFGCDPAFVSEVGPVIGAHVGPGLVGFGGIPLALLGAAPGRAGERLA